MSSRQLQRSTPEQQGVNPEAVLYFINELEQARTQDMRQDIHSFMLLRHGYVIAEGCWTPYAKEMPHAMFSLSKSFTSTAVGFAAAEGLLSVEHPVVSYFAKECPQPSAHLSKLRIKDLLTMSTGQKQDPVKAMLYQKEGDWVKAFFEEEVTREPGSQFSYNSGATYLLSVIIQKVSGHKLVDYLEPRLFAPLGIEHPHWNECPKGYNAGGFGIWLQTEDLARLGQLYLNKGKWEGRQLLPEEWVEEATGYQINNLGSDPDLDWREGYGYQFWRCRHNAFRGDGAYGQYCVILPEQDMVCVITAGMCDKQKPLDALWNNIIPGVDHLPEKPSSKGLADKLSSLRVLLPEGSRESNAAAVIDGKCFALGRNTSEFDTVTFRFEKDRIRMSGHKAGKVSEYHIGIGFWSENTINRKGRRHPAYMTGIWTEWDTLLIQCRLVETPYAFCYKFTFREEKADMESQTNLYLDESEWDQDLCW